MRKVSKNLEAHLGKERLERIAKDYFKNRIKETEKALEALQTQYDLHSSNWKKQDEINERMRMLKNWVNILALKLGNREVLAREGEMLLHITSRKIEKIVKEDEDGVHVALNFLRKHGYLIDQDKISHFQTPNWQEIYDVQVYSLKNWILNLQRIRVGIDTKIIVLTIILSLDRNWKKRKKNSYVEFPVFDKEIMRTVIRKFDQAIQEEKEKRGLQGIFFEIYKDERYKKQSEIIGDLQEGDFLQVEKFSIKDKHGIESQIANQLAVACCDTDNICISGEGAAVAYLHDSDIYLLRQVRLNIQGQKYLHVVAVLAVDKGKVTMLSGDNLFQLLDQETLDELQRQSEQVPGLTELLNKSPGKIENTIRLHRLIKYLSELPENQIDLNNFKDLNIFDLLFVNGKYITFGDVSVSDEGFEFKRIGVYALRIKIYNRILDENLEIQKRFRARFGTERMSIDNLKELDGLRFNKMKNVNNCLLLI